MYEYDTELKILCAGGTANARLHVRRGRTRARADPDDLARGGTRAGGSVIRVSGRDEVHRVTVAIARRRH